MVRLMQLGGVRKQWSTVSPHLGRVVSWHGRGNQYLDVMARTVMEMVKDDLGVARVNRPHLVAIISSALVNAMKLAQSTGELLKATEEGKDEAVVGMANAIISPVDLVAKMIVTVLRPKKGQNLQELQGVGEIVAEVHRHLLSEWLVEPLKKAERMSLLTEREMREVVDEYVADVFQVLTTLVGTVGGFGVDIMTAADAASLITKVKEVMEVEVVEIIEEMSRGTHEVWQGEYEKYGKALLGLAKKGGIVVTTVKPAARMAAKRKARESDGSSLPDLDDDQQSLQSVGSMPSSPDVKRTRRM
jgi:hypothetical protein